MNKKTVTIVLVVVAILLVGFLIFRPGDKQEEIPQEPVVTEPTETEGTEEETIFSEGVKVVGVTSADDKGFVADEYELVLEEGEEIYEDANALDLSKYVAAGTSVNYTFDGTEVIRLAGDQVLEEAKSETEVAEEETVKETEPTETETEGTEPIETESTETEEEKAAIKIEAGDKLALVLENGVKTIVVYKA